MEQVSMTGRFIRPFVRVLSGYEGVSRRSLDRFSALAREPRVDLQAGHETLQHWVRATGDADLGLKAGSNTYLGEGGVLEFAIHSASTVREGIAVANRHAHLFSDALEPKLEIEGNRALIRLDNTVPWPRVAADFTLSVWYTLHARAQLADVPEIEVWLAHDRPDDVSEYEHVFGRAKLRFNAPCYGFAFDAEYVDLPLASGDPSLHSVHCEHLQSLRMGPRDERGFAPRVRELVASELRRGRPTAGKVARQLQISRRTLVRKLGQEGTSFKAQLDGLRCQLALGMVAADQLPLAKISALLGFTSVSVFHRAFRRWTSQTPIQYRKSAAAQTRPTGPGSDTLS
jgi:AraC-like DNA-binding protein